MRRVVEQNSFLYKYQELLDSYLTRPDSNYYDCQEKLLKAFESETPTDRIAVIEHVAHILQAAEAGNSTAEQKGKVTLLKRAFNVTQSDGWYAALFGRTVKIYQLNDPLRVRAPIASLRCYAFTSEQIQVYGFLAKDWQLVYIDANTRKIKVCSGPYLNQIAFPPGHFYVIPNSLYQAIICNDSNLAEQFFKQPADQVIRHLEIKARDLIRVFTGKDRELIHAAQNLLDNLADQERTIQTIMKHLYPTRQISTEAPRAHSYSSASQPQMVSADEYTGPSQSERETMAKLQRQHEVIFRLISSARQQKVTADRDKEKREWERKLGEVQGAKSNLLHDMAALGFELNQPRLGAISDRVGDLKTHLERLQKKQLNIENAQNDRNYRMLKAEYEKVMALSSVSVFLDLVTMKLAYHGQIGDPKSVAVALPSPKVSRSPEADRASPQRVSSSPVVQRQSDNRSYPLILPRVSRDEGPSVFQEYGKKILLIGAIVGLVILTGVVSAILHAKGLSPLAWFIDQFSTTAAQAILNFFGAHAVLGTFADVGFGIAAFSLTGAIIAGALWTAKRVYQCIANCRTPVDQNEMPMQVLGNPIAANLDLRRQSKKSPFGNLVVANLDLRGRDEWQHLEAQPEPTRCNLFSCLLPWTGASSRSHEYTSVSVHEPDPERMNSM